MASQNPIPAPSLGTTLGPIYIGATVAAILFGITNLQVAIYYKKYPDDWWVYRYSVGVLWVLDGLHVAFSTHALYHYLIDLFGDYDSIYSIIWSFKLHTLLNMVIIVGVQVVYAIRIWKLGRHFGRILPWFVVLIAIVALGTGVFSIYEAYTISNFLLLPSIKKSICTVFAMPAMCDFVIAFSMCYYLHKCREVSGFSRTSTMLWDLIRLVVISGLATSAWSLLVLLTYLVWPNTLIFLGVDLILPKLYVNSLLVMLNCRRDHRPRTNTECSEPKAIRFAPNSSGADTDEVNISVSMNSVQSFDRAEEPSLNV